MRARQNKDVRQAGLQGVAEEAVAGVLLLRTLVQMRNTRTLTGRFGVCGGA
jgi:hypothetical protein